MYLNSERPALVMHHDRRSVHVAERLPQFIGGPDDGAARLAGQRLGLATSGSVNGQTALSLARLQPREMIIVDPGYFKLQSMLTHAIPPAAIGHAKATWTAKLVKQISPATKVTAYVAKAQDLSPSIWANCDHIFAAPDNLPCEKYLGELAMHLGIPLVLASVHGESLTAQVRCFANDRANGPCPTCAYNEDEWKWHDESLLFSCTGGDDVVRTRPTMSTSFLCSMAANLAVTQGVRNILGLGSPVLDSLLSWNGYTHQSIVASLRHNPACLCDHRRWERVHVSTPLPELSVARLLQIVGIDSLLGVTTLLLRIEGYSFAERAVCCGSDHSVGRFVAHGDILDVRCPTCGATPEVPGFYSRSEGPCDLLPRQVALSELGVKHVASLRLSVGERVVLVCGPTLSPENPS